MKKVIEIVNECIDRDGEGVDFNCEWTHTEIIAGERSLVVKNGWDDNAAVSVTKLAIKREGKRGFIILTNEEVIELIATLAKCIAT